MIFELLMYKKCHVCVYTYNKMIVVQLLSKMFFHIFNIFRDIFEEIKINHPIHMNVCSVYIRYVKLSV